MTLIANDGQPAQTSPAPISPAPISPAPTSPAANAHSASSASPIWWLIAAVIVVAVTIAMRWPAGGESFWLDELHSAWVVSDDFGSTSDRAADGNQTTGYFHSLWIWKNLVTLAGLDRVFGFEWAMRLSSVIANAFAALVLLVGVAKSSRSLVGGTVAALMLACDRNAIFFGGELRSYAVIMLASAVSVFAFMRSIGRMDLLLDADGGAGNEQGPHDDEVDRATRWRLILLFSVCVGALIHPTSLGTLGLLFPTVFVLSIRTGRFRLGAGDVTGVIVGLVTLGLLAMSSLPHSWQRRDLWRAFGRATDLSQWWFAWDWWSLLIFPAIVVAMISAACLLIDWSRGLNQEIHDERIGPVGGCVRGRLWMGSVPGAIGTLATAIFFAASYLDWVPLWHRRYFIAALPLLAWTTGEFAGHCQQALRQITLRWGGKGSGIVRRHGTGLVVLLIFVGGLLFHQGVLSTIVAGRFPMQLRGEAWRQAVQRVNSQRDHGDHVWLDSGLIEASVLSAPPDRWPQEYDRIWEYLQFPVRGPYRIDGVKLVSPNADSAWLKRLVDGLPTGQSRVWLVTRSHPTSVALLLKRLRVARECDVVWQTKLRPAVLQINFPSTQPDPKSEARTR